MKDRHIHIGENTYIQLDAGLLRISQHGRSFALSAAQFAALVAYAKPFFSQLAAEGK